MLHLHETVRTHRSICTRRDKSIASWAPLTLICMSDTYTCAGEAAATAECLRINVTNHLRLFLTFVIDLTNKSYRRGDTCLQQSTVYRQFEKKKKMLLPHAFYTCRLFCVLFSELYTPPLLVLFYFFYFILFLIKYSTHVSVLEIAFSELHELRSIIVDLSQLLCVLASNHHSPITPLICLKTTPQVNIGGVITSLTKLLSAHLRYSDRHWQITVCLFTVFFSFFNTKKFKIKLIKVCSSRGLRLVFQI